MARLFFIFCVIVFFGFQSGENKHQAWDELLRKYVNAEGRVQYMNFSLEDRKRLKKYLVDLAKQLPASNWSIDERKAYWINVYNAVTVNLILDNYPVESIKDLQPFFSMPGINTVWHSTYFLEAEEAFSLDEIEHNILRVEFNDPRIHFAINCASKSCPSLRNEAYNPDKLDSQLEEQAREFINSKFHNHIAKDKIEISKIFSWFRGDFTKEGKLIQFLNKYSSISIDPNAEISFLPYNWELNE